MPALKNQKTRNPKNEKPDPNVEEHGKPLSQIRNPDHHPGPWRKLWDHSAQPGPTTPEDPVCARPGFEDSFICAKLQELGVEYPETARDIILDTNDIAILSDAYTASQARAVCRKLRGCLDLTEITYATFFDNVMQDTSKAKRLSSVLTRRFAPLKSVEIIRASDRNLLLYAIDAVEENL